MVEYVYSAWGNHKALVLNNKGQMVEYASPDNEGENKSAYSELSQLNPFRYRGYYYDTETRLYFLKTRYYDPEVGRFITIDDLSYLDPETINGLNFYAYCGNNPAMNVDPNGKFFLSLLLGFVFGAIASFGVNVLFQGATKGWNHIDFREAGAQALLGGVFGALSVFGAGIALGMVHMSTFGALAITGVVSLAAGIGAYNIQYLGTDAYNEMDMIGAGLIAVAQGFTSLITGAIMGGSGFYSNLKPGQGLISILKNHGMGMTEYLLNYIVRTVVKGILVSSLSFVLKLIKGENNARSSYGG